MPDWISGLFGLALMVAYWPGISGVASTPRWDVAALLAIPLFFAPRIQMTAAHWFGLALVGWLFATLLWSDGGTDSRLDGIENGVEIVIGLVAFAVGSTTKDLRPLFIGAAIGLGINVAVGVAQSFGWQGLIESTGKYHVAGLFYNPDRLAAAAAIVAVALVSLKGYRWLPLVLPALVLAPSRGAWLGLVVALMSLSRFAKAWFALLGFVILSLALYAPLYDIKVDISISERLMMWHDTILNLNWFGHGLGSFRECFIQFAHFFDIAVEQSRPEHPHNEFLWLAFEGGTPAVVLAALFALALWRASLDQPVFAVLVCLSVIAGFAMPFHDPATLVLGAVVAGFVAGDRVRARIVTVDRGISLRPWLAADVAGRRSGRT